MRFSAGIPPASSEVFVSFLSPSRHADLREIRWGSTEWIDLVQDGDQWRTLFNRMLNLLVPLNVGKSLSNCTTGGF